MSGTVNLSLNEARNLTLDALSANKTDPINARIVANALVDAEANGQAGHGLSRISSYCAQARTGKLDGFAKPTARQISSVVQSVDARYGFAYPAIELALPFLKEATTQNGLALSAIRHSHHFGQAGAHCERLAKQGMIAFVFGNAPKAIAAHGGKTPMFGTNPIAFAAPNHEGDPLVIDLALSRVARGKVMAAQRAGKSIPEGWSLDKAGQPTTDPKEALEGTMIPIGEAKGAALAMMIEIMAAGLCGTAFGFEASSLFSGEGAAPDLGQVILAINTDMVSGGAFTERMQTLVNAIEAEQGARLPGTSRLAARNKAKLHGIDVPKHIYEEAVTLSGQPV
ncbi:(2R)-3-sulfolactate dehydrogenase (NADP(+)) [Pseudovibrio axinellae]|uniref:(2R)-3-sulfolactate dehydrogenase (NADP(+)) n=1 Tax=Pseudovibrio axinellae TaxID=989403 RepID=A0A165TYM1_9HYPH|nr:Ldh family oxidoreductase [Pseudovibrio axinellae]KZL08476.1 (2R)-3-sulfolactate dehydrogenase (NADP(+)) [Pseudovibrio axinellae]SEP75323.1 (2R)-3-sulfolactate dehydrogenase (NADP+) [Pseudovibrio axinellae]